MKRIRITLVLLCLCTGLQAQLGGERTYAFLDLIPAPRVAAMGGALNAQVDGDVSLSYFNPAVLNEQMHQTVSLSYVQYLADIRFGYAAFGYQWPKVGTVSAGIHYVNYGSFIEADEDGHVSGSFTASEYALHFSYGRTVTLWDVDFLVGVSLKPVLSHLETYQSFGVLCDAGISYQDEANGVTASLVLRNVGTQIKRYTHQSEQMPVDLQLGVTKRLKNAPFLISLVAQHLEEKLREEPQALNEDTGLMEKVNRSFMEEWGEEVYRHLVLGVEITPFEGFSLRAGYNALRREELTLNQKKSTVGFSWGAALRIRQCTLEYANAKYHLAGSTHQMAVLLHL